jgi:TonB family protein
MAAGIQGVVVLNCVVQADGTVGDIRVARSLDALHGLDTAAIDALKQWRYSPATKAGKAVAVTVTAELSFTMRSGPSPLPWPTGFDAPTVGAWKTADADVEGLRFHLEYPERWSLQPNPSSTEVIRLTSRTSLATLIIDRPQPASGSFNRPFSPDQLKELVDRMNTVQRAKAANTEGGSFGQVSAGRHIWVWSEWVGGPGAPDDVHRWRFETIAAEQLIGVTMTITVRSSVVEESQQELAAELGSMLRRMMITSR